MQASAPIATKQRTMHASLPQSLVRLPQIL
jgi:hypothetical protein